MINHMSSKLRDEITCTFPNFNGCTVEILEWINNFIQYFMMDVSTYPCWMKVSSYCIVRESSDLLISAFIVLIYIYIYIFFCKVSYNAAISFTPLNQVTSTQLNSTQRCLFPEIYSIDQLQHGTETHTGLFVPLLLSSKSSILLPLCLTPTG